MISTDPVLCATDFSHRGDQALRYAATLAQQLEATLLIVHVIAESEDGGQVTESDRLLLGAAQPDAVNCERIFARGNPANEIVKLANARHASHIVVGTHGRREPHCVTIGATAQRIIRQAACPVTVVRDEELNSHVPS